MSDLQVSGEDVALKHVVALYLAIPCHIVRKIFSALSWPCIDVKLAGVDLPLCESVQAISTAVVDTRQR